MKLLATLFPFLFVFHFNPATGQSLKKTFNALAAKKDTAGQRKLLATWEKKDRNDPELYVAYFNYYVSKSKKEVMALGQHPKGKEALQLMDQDTSKKAPVAFLYGDTQFDPVLLSKGFSWVNLGIEKFPRRLDLRFGKIYMLGQLEDYERFTTEIIQTVVYSAIIQNKWTWTDSKPLDDPQKFMLSTIQSYQVQLYNTGNDALLDHMERIAKAVLKQYPEHVESLSNLSIVYLLQKKYDEALEVLFKAEKQNPKDEVVLSNIAQAYKLKGDHKNAISYYELALKHGDEATQKYAQQQINELKKK